MLPDTAEPLDGVAIIGMAGRFPGARNLAEFWRNLLAGVDSIAWHAPFQPPLENHED